MLKTVQVTDGTQAGDMTAVAPAARRYHLQRVLDWMVLIVAAPMVVPLGALIALGVALSSRGPVFFTQERIGLGAEPFRVYKFRTMVDGDNPLVPDPTRITKVGALLRRLSLDELPQLLNVGRGEMSIVGPRPTVASQVERYDARQRGRLLTRPGLTGLAQVTGRNAIPWSERIEIDLAYVARWSMRRDLAILARTALVVVRREGTYKGPRGGFDLPPPGAPDG